MISPYAECFRLTEGPIFRVVLGDGSPRVDAHALNALARFETAVLEAAVLKKGVSAPGGAGDISEERFEVAELVCTFWVMGI